VVDTERVGVDETVERVLDHLDGTA